MNTISRISTPIKTNRLLIAPSYQPGAFDSHAVDCPFPFWHNGRFYMTFVGWDAKGYQTGLASSEDLIHWQKEGLLIGRGPAGSPTEYNIALTCLLRDHQLYGRGELKKVRGEFVGVYHAYPDPGYEIGPGAIGFCFSPDLKTWRVDPPILYAQDGAPWEQGGLYKAWLIEENGLYSLFYNAKNQTEGSWHEQTGMATSTDLLHWQRYPQNPVLRNGGPGSFDEVFASDPVVLKDGDQWVMFYFGLARDGHARDGAATSPDLLHWTKIDALLLDTGPEGAVDSLHAHKPGILANQNGLYHFYCAVSRQIIPIGSLTHNEGRGISLAHQ